MQFLINAILLLENAGIHTWLAGGWAEELWGMVPPKAHHDIDLLYPAEDLSAVDRFLTHADLSREHDTNPVIELVADRLPHKRAFDVHGDLVEVLLASPMPSAPSPRLPGEDAAPEQCEHRYQSSFFNGLYRLTWPEDTFCHTLLLKDIPLRVVSQAALAHYRACRPQVDVALAAWQQQTPAD